jgi:TonB family protein
MEGWVRLGFMVSPDGKPYEVHVLEAVGDRAFVQEALRSIKRATFEPARLDGTPIDAGTTIKLKFSIVGGAKGAGENFVRRYDDVNKAIDKHDRVAADAAMSKIVVTNLYEDAYFGVTQYRYAVEWGDNVQAMAGLRRAIASESTAHYLAKPVFQSALRSMVLLDAKSMNFADALINWQILRNTGIDDAKTGLQSVIDKIEALKASDQTYAVPGEITDSAWPYLLFKNRFSLAVSEGHISTIKLLCERKLVTFQFDPALAYQVSERAGKCWILVDGDPGTKFKLVQL